MNSFYKNSPNLFISALAVASRVFVWILALLSTFVIDDYDSALDTLFDNDKPGLGLFVFLRWDAFYFLHLSKEGYIYEQEHAFFPLYPLFTRALANLCKNPLY